jgi:hypothetical protein
MANSTPSRLGQVNQAGDVQANFLKTFAGEVLTSFMSNNVFAEKTSVRNIQNGKSASFPAIGQTSASYHVVGNEITGKNISHGEQIITIDDLLISDVFIANIDEAMNHYDVRSEYSTQAGYALAKTMDTNLAQVGVLAARAANPITGLAGGSKLVGATFKTDSAALAAGIFAARQTLDEKDVPEGDTYAYFKPAQYYLLAQNTVAINSQFGGQGAYAEGSIIKIGGVPIIKTNNLPTTVVATGVAKYQGTFTGTAGLVMHKGAVGTVKLMDLAVESEYDIRRQGTLLVAKYAVGHGILRPNASVELSTTA